MIMNHPEVDWIEQTGYPSWNQPEELFCECCGRNLESKTVYFDEDFEILCKKCLLDRHKRDDY